MILAGQVPLGTANTDAPWHDLGARPDANATSHLVFETVNSLLQHWPNTRYRNGHTIVPGTVPTGTLLYHGRQDSNLPTIPEWTATEPEHAFFFCSASPANESTETVFVGCWQLTLVAARPLKVLYFDGSSAAKMADGPLDAQDLLVWGQADPLRTNDERARIDDLCAWGKDLGLDGFVREIMLCDFTAGVDLVSADFLAAWWTTPPTMGQPPEPPSMTIAPTPEDTLPVFQELRATETVRASGWHNHYPGETRVVLDPTRLFSFYDPSLAPSLITQRAGQERWDHRHQGISRVDLATVMERLKSELNFDLGDDSRSGSGVDWQTLYRVLVNRYADRLELLAYLLDSVDTNTLANITARTTIVQRHLRAMLTPYTLYAARPTDPAEVDNSDNWAIPVWHACATRHTAQLHGLYARFTPSESLLLRAFDETSREICRVVVRMWAAGRIARVVQEWRTDTHTLMAWLDWNVWVKCAPECGAEETCYLPTWPYFWLNPTEGEGEGDWEKPQPRCIRQFEPYSRL
ncbi:hypothetical protein DFH07DRAFT_1009711 [Mycena maculata]|uniref:Uncharacterized protein n=1 Tax=Mycena maculata TaxID=230809 RepID=A0AAD7HF38_9AGAR|nr:hypothetical protein DFH07DRAFT_1009711 [Mycena maculata]